MKPEEFRKHAHNFVDWMADYMENVTDYPVKSQSEPGVIYNQINAHFPTEGEDISVIFNDFQEIVMPGITHWQSPNFYAYFNANSSPPSVLAEMLTATLGVQGMKWDTSPASTELENKMMEWLRDAMSIPQSWTGVIQDTGSTSTLASLLTAREMKTGFGINKRGFEGYTKLRVYCSAETHSSVEKGAKIAGFGKANVIKIPTDDRLELIPEELEKAIQKDLENGFIPCAVVSTLGTTGTTAIDPVDAIGKIAQQYDLWHHIDAAYLGPILLLPEYQFLIKGIERADSLFFNPHKWMLTNFDCSAYFVKDKNALINTFAILPEYLKTSNDDKVDNHCDWGVPLGRRFRSLKLWFVMRYYGLNGIQKILRDHIRMAEWLENEIRDSKDFKMIIPRNVNLVCFHLKPEGIKDKEQINNMNEALMNQINKTGKIYLTHTKVNGVFTLRIVIGQTNVTENHITEAWDHIQTESAKILATY